MVSLVFVYRPHVVFARVETRLLTDGENILEPLRLLSQKRPEEDKGTVLCTECVPHPWWLHRQIPISLKIPWGRVINLAHASGLANPSVVHLHRI